MWYVNWINVYLGDNSDEGFILTMWYVNKAQLVIADIPYNGFILTMWYVNSNISKHCWVIWYSFYINYVICKLFRKHCFIISFFTFYINYVICKCVENVENFNRCESFILTMWYVNTCLLIHVERFFTSFILTMWYVNYMYII